MIRGFQLRSSGLHGSVVQAGASLPDDTLWIDLVDATAEEEARIEQLLSIDVPTREEMREIETSNRFYEEDDVLERVGRNGDLNSKARETLGSLTRLIGFLQQSNGQGLDEEVKGRLHSVFRDAEQMSNHAAFLGSKVQFMLDATLGMINIDQNNILKIFSVATLVLLPPSVIGAIFGMNFDIIPSLHSQWGFWGALVLMAISAVVPLIYFRQRGWL